MDHAKKLHTYAARIARRFRKNQPPPFDDDMVAYVDSHPETLMDSLGGLVEHLDAGAPKSDNLVKAYLFLIGLQLEHVRYQVDRHYDWARELIARFQDEVVELAHAGRLPDMLLADIAVALRDAKLEPDPRLFDAVSEAMDAGGPPPGAPTDLSELLAAFNKEFQGTEFDAAGAISQFTYAMPTEVRVALAAAMATCEFPMLREVVPLLALDDRKEVRKGVAAVLADLARALTPAGLRRLIAIRSWLPEDERPLVDKAIKAARRQGVECAQWTPGAEAEAHASMIDGSGAQGFLVVSSLGRKYRLSSVLLRLRSGIVDAWSSNEPESKRSLDRQLGKAEEQAALQTVSRAYLDRAVQHHLAVACSHDQVPPVGLLEVAEVLGASDWRPDPLDVGATIDELFEQLPAATRQPEAIARCLGESDEWALLSGITESWFEDDQEVADMLTRSRARRFATLSRRVLTKVIEPRRQKWAEQLLWAALWLKDVSDPQDRLWVNFLLTAHAVRQGHPLKDIPLFGMIADKTVMATGG